MLRYLHYGWILLSALQSGTIIYQVERISVSKVCIDIMQVPVQDSVKNVCH